MSQIISHHSALIYTMVIVSAADANMSDAELHMIGEIVQKFSHLQRFQSGPIGNNSTGVRRHFIRRRRVGCGLGFGPRGYSGQIKRNRLCNSGGSGHGR